MRSLPTWLQSYSADSRKGALRAPLLKSVENGDFFSTGCRAWTSVSVLFLFWLKPGKGLGMDVLTQSSLAINSSKLVYFRSLGLKKVSKLWCYLVYSLPKPCISAYVVKLALMSWADSHRKRCTHPWRPGRQRRNGTHPSFAPAIKISIWKCLLCILTVPKWSSTVCSLEMCSLHGVFRCSCPDFPTSLMTAKHRAWSTWICICHWKLKGHSILAPITRLPMKVSFVSA